MTLFLFLLLACHTTPPLKDTAEKGAHKGMHPDRVAAVEVERPVRMPSGRAVTRECYVKATEKSGGSWFNRSASKPKANQAPMAAPPASVAAPSPAPTAQAMRDSMRSNLQNKMGAPSGAAGGSAGSDDGFAMDAPAVYEGGALRPVVPGKAAAQGDAAPTASLGAMAEAEPTAPRSVDATTGSTAMAKSSAGPSLEESERAPSDVATASTPAPDAPMKGEMKVVGKKDTRSATRGRGHDADMARRELVKAPEPQLDWGGTTYLSNDDSMSLASAQRLLYSVKNGVRFSTSEVRPHELLNYFSFDTAPVQHGDLFSVMASAEQTASDTLSVALAVKGANPPRQPLDLTLVVDRSGSMSAEGRMDYLKRGLEVMTGSLRKGDRVDLVLFDDDLCVPLEDYVVGRDDPDLLSEAISDMQPRGSTDLNAGLKEGYRLARARVAEARSDLRNQRLMVITDALLNTGEVRADIVTEIGKAYEEHDIRLTGVGVGREFNDKVLDMLTEKGKGAYVYLGSEAVVDRVFGAGFDSLTRTIAHDVRFALHLPPSLAMAKFYGEESSKNAEDIQPINYYAGTTQVFLQDLKIRPGYLQDSDPLVLTVTYTDARTGESSEQRFTTTLGDAMAADHHNLDKARALMSWSDVLLAQAMGGDPCSQPLFTYQDRAASLPDDAEIAYVNDLLAKRCHTEMPSRLSTVAYKVKVNSDTPIAEVAIQCAGTRRSEKLTGGETVVSFNVPPGSCALTMEGSVPMRASVKVPQTGGEVRCMIRGGRLQCS